MLKRRQNNTSGDIFFTFIQLFNNLKKNWKKIVLYKKFISYKKSFISLNKVQEGVNIILTKQLDGPQDIKLTLTMNVFDANRRPFGSSVANIFLLVSEFPF